jgi:ABC-type multidrug transport system fused ATPase/permease subunit
MLSRFFNTSDIFRESSRDIVLSIDSSSRRLLIQALSIVVISALFLSVSPLYMAKVIDAMSIPGYTAHRNIFTYAIIYLVLRFAGQAFVDLRWTFINPVLYAISYSLCNLIASRLSSIFRHEGRAGDGAAAIAEQVTVISKMGLGSVTLLYGVLAVIIPTAIELFVVCIAIGFVIGPRLILYVTLGMIIFMIAVSFKRHRELTSAAKAHQLDNVVSGTVAEYISNPSLVREFSAKGFMQSRIDQQIAASILEHQRFFRIKTERSLYLTLTTCLVYSILLLTAVVNAKSLAVTAGSFFLLIIYLDRILQPLTNASVAINNIQNGLVSMKGAYTLLKKLEKEAALAPFNREPNITWEKISIVSQRSFFCTNQVLNIGKGTWVRLRGPSGSGKSTYLRRIYQKLLSDSVYSGADMHYLNPVPITIRGSVFDNIALGDTTVTKEICQTYWTAWHLKFGNNQIDIDAETKQLSAGEIQFLAICRTLVRRPRLVIFDEATNSIDIHSEPKIWTMIRQALPETTIFVVSHREVEGISFDHEEWLEQNSKASTIS